MKKSLGPQTIVLPTPVFVVGSYDAAGRPNIMTAAWGGICCSDPPCVTVSLRKARYTYANIMQTRAFTISIPSVEHAEEADYAGMFSGCDEDKFAVAKLTPVKSELVNAPYVKEFPLVVECELLHTFDLGVHTQFVGKILDVKADGRVLNEKGQVDAAKVNPLTFSPGAGGYYALGEFVGQAFSIGQKVHGT